MIAGLTVTYSSVTVMLLRSFFFAGQENGSGRLIGCLK